MGFSFVRVFGVFGCGVDGEAGPFFRVVVPPGFEREEGVVVVQGEAEGFQFAFEIGRVVLVSIGPFVKVPQCLVVLRPRGENTVLVVNLSFDLTSHQEDDTLTLSMAVSKSPALNAFVAISLTSAAILWYSSPFMSLPWSSGKSS